MNYTIACRPFQDTKFSMEESQHSECKCVMPFTFFISASVVFGPGGSPSISYAFPSAGSMAAISIL